MVDAVCVSLHLLILLHIFTMSKVIIIVVVAIFVIGGIVWFMRRGGDGAPQEGASAPDATPAESASAGLPSSGERAAPDSSQVGEGGLKVEYLQIGKGATVKKGATVSVHYTGTLLNGTKFDSSVDRGAPFSFVVGAGQVIDGWDQALLGKRVGDKLRVTIPPELGYGERGAGSAIPPNATLVFEIEILKVK